MNGTLEVFNIFQMQFPAFIVCVACLASSLHHVAAFYVPGVAPMDFSLGQPVDIKVSIHPSLVCAIYFTPFFFAFYRRLS
jgi:hypothetical protein